MFLSFVMTMNVQFGYIYLADSLSHLYKFFCLNHCGMAHADLLQTDITNEINYE